MVPFEDGDWRVGWLGEAQWPNANIRFRIS